MKDFFKSEDFELLMKTSEYIPDKAAKIANKKLSKMIGKELSTVQLQRMWIDGFNDAWSEIMPMLDEMKKALEAINNDIINIPNNSPAVKLAVETLTKYYEKYNYD